MLAQKLSSESEGEERDENEWSNVAEAQSVEPPTSSTSQETSSTSQETSRERIPERNTIMDKLSPPTPMQFTGNLAYNWKRFKQRFEIYLAASGIGGRDEKVQAQILLHVIGEDALDIFNSFQIEDENLKFSTVVAKFEAYFIPTKNITYERYKFFSCDQKSGVSFDQYLAELYVLSKSCEFQDLRDSLIKDCIVCGIADNGLREIVA